MDTLKRFFPHAFKAVDVGQFIVSLIVYAVIGIIGGFIIGILAIIPLLGLIFILLGSLLELYVLVGVILSILVFLKVIK